MRLDYMLNYTLTIQFVNTFGSSMNIFYIVKVKILQVIKWSYKSPNPPPPSTMSLRCIDDIVPYGVHFVYDTLDNV